MRNGNAHEQYTRQLPKSTFHHQWRCKRRPKGRRHHGNLERIHRTVALRLSARIFSWTQLWNRRGVRILHSKNLRGCHGHIIASTRRRNWRIPSRHDVVPRQLIRNSLQ